MVRFIVKVFVYLLLITPVFSQNEFANWAFGKEAGLSFISGTPIPIDGLKGNASEGTATISDFSGNLLFYVSNRFTTNYFTIYNRDNQIMLNGDSLLGQKSSAQGALIVPQPGNNCLYYVFTQAAQGGDFGGSQLFGGLAYSVVNINGDNGLGEVTVKNDTLLNKSTEKMAATMHANGKDVWIMAHGLDSDSFYAYLLTQDGLSTPVISKQGAIHPSVNIPGQMRFSPNGQRLAITNRPMTFEVFDFNNASGLVNYNYTLNSISNSIYGLEFSPNSNVLYTTHDDSTKIVQYDLSSGVPATVDASKYKIAMPATSAGIQLAIDGKIYCARRLQDSIDCIHDPNVLGVGCNYQYNMISVSNVPTSSCESGLSSVISNYTSRGDLSINSSFTLSNINCSDTISFNTDIDTCIKIVNRKWDFGDPASGALNIDSVVNPTHYYTSTGEYIITLIEEGICEVDTFVDTIFITKESFFNLDSVNVCAGDSASIDSIPDYYDNYLWSPSTGLDIDTTAKPTFVGTVNERYLVETSYLGCIDTYAIDVLISSITVDAGKDTTINFGENITLMATGAMGYIWTDSSTLSCGNCVAPNAIPQETTTYYVTGTDKNGCSDIDSITVNVLKQFFLPNALSLNNDENNELEWDLRGITNNVHVLIADRLGNIIYESKKLVDQWEVKDFSDLTTVVVSIDMGDQKRFVSNVTILK